jgi:hypothetical protein
LQLRQGAGELELGLNTLGQMNHGRAGVLQHGGRDEGHSDAAMGTVPIVLLGSVGIKYCDRIVLLDKSSYSMG